MFKMDIYTDLLVSVRVAPLSLSKRYQTAYKRKTFGKFEISRTIITQGINLRKVLSVTYGRTRRRTYGQIEPNYRKASLLKSKKDPVFIYTQYVCLSRSGFKWVLDIFRLQYIYHECILYVFFL